MATPRPPQAPNIQLPSPRILLSSMASTHTTAPIGVSLHRTEKLEQYKLISEHEPWGLKAKADTEAFLNQQQQKAAEERRKRETFRLGLDAQLRQHSDERGLDQRRKRDEALYEQELHANYLKLMEEDRKNKRARYLAEVEDRKQLTMRAVSAREQQAISEFESSLKQRSFGEGLQDNSKLLEQERRKRHKELMAEAKRANELLRVKREEAVREEYALDRRTLEEQIKREEEERSRHLEKINRRRCAVESKLEMWEAVRRDEEEKRRLAEERIEQERLAQLARAQAEYDASLQRKKARSNESRVVLVSQMEEHRRNKKARRDELLRERAELEADAARYHEEQRRIRSEARARNLRYGVELHDQMNRTHERTLTELISATPR